MVSGRRGSSGRQGTGVGRRALITLFLPSMLLLGAVALTALKFREGSKGGPDLLAPFSRFTGAPIPGEQVTLDEAMARVSYRLFLLHEAMRASDPCTGVPGSLRLTGIWATEIGSAPTELRRVGMTYTHGVWITLTPKQAWAASRDDELLPVEEAFSPDDYPDGLTTDSIRGHVAWTKELDPDFSCEVAILPQPQPSGSLGPVASPQSDVYDPRLTASLRWMENQASVQLVAPFQLPTVKSLAESGSWR